MTWSERTLSTWRTLSKSSRAPYALLPSHGRAPLTNPLPKDLHPANVAVLDLWRATQPPYGPCAASHPHVASCAFSPIDRFFTVFRWTLPIYGALHFVPMLLFKRQAVMHAPKAMMLRASWGTMRSASFLGAFNAIFQGNVIKNPPKGSAEFSRALAEKRFLLRCAELASCAGGKEAGPCVAACCARIQGVVLARGLVCGDLGAHRDETSAWGACDVCAPEGPRECVGRCARKGARVSDGEAWERAGESACASVLQGTYCVSIN